MREENGAHPLPLPDWCRLRLAFSKALEGAIEAVGQVEDVASTFLLLVELLRALGMVSEVLAMMVDHPDLKAKTDALLKVVAEFEGK